MNWFDDQVKKCKINDQEVFEDSLNQIVQSLTGKKDDSQVPNRGEKFLDDMGYILQYYHIKLKTIPDEIKKADDPVAYLISPYGMNKRSVHLEKGWYQDASGAMLGVRKKDKCTVALIPRGFYGYCYIDSNGKYIKIDQHNEEEFEKEAVAFYKPFPLKKMSLGSLLSYIIGTLSIKDYLFFGIITMLLTFMGTMWPKLNNLLFSTVIESESYSLLGAILVFSVCLIVSSQMISSIKSLFMARINTKLGLSIESATMMRILSLPVSFFKDYSSGELSARAGHMNALAGMLSSAVLSTGLTSIFSLIYILQIFNFAPSLVVPSMCIILSTMIISTLSALFQMHYSKKQMELGAKESGMNYAHISGIQKIKLSGAEKRVFARWGKIYSKEVKLAYNPPFFLKISGVITTSITLLGSVIIYYISVRNGMDVASYYAFNTAYGMVSGAFSSLAGVVLNIAKIKPVLEMAKPIMDTIPEISKEKQIVTKISGAVSFENVSFRYDEKKPMIIDNLSLNIKSGQYVALVGKTGCGKSTLLRLMIGFEKANEGAIYYDRKNINSIDMKSLRRQLGVVMQNGQLMQGDIYSNITLSAPWLTMDDAWKAAEIAGVAEDIRNMPMGMHTVITEGSGGLSGGQKQRLLIARAVASKPKILLFDEATSALDNITQKKISEALDQLKCTRIVIAHRLSTIRNCDRIIVLDEGKIAEDGTYDELIEKNGIFAELVARQVI